MSHYPESSPGWSGKTPLLTQVAPNCLMDDHGHPRFGYFDGPVTELALDRFDYCDSMDKPASRWARHFHYKQFQFVSVLTADYLLGAALADIRYLGSGFAYLYDIRANQLTEVSWLRPMGMQYRSVPSPMSGTGKIGGKQGTLTLNIHQGQWQLQLQTDRIDAELSLDTSPLSLPLALCNPTGYNGWTYTQKHNALMVSGKLLVDGASVALGGARSGYDFSAGYMRRDTSWRWASLNGETETGLSIGFNLAAGVNETGLNENACWIDGRRYLLGPVQFEFDRLNPRSSWQVYSLDGRLSLNFSPLNHRHEKRDLWLLRSNFRQFMGYFEGFVIDDAGIKHHVQRQLGLTEDHYARW
ncbi:MAG: DUF2804 domain-containing protein [Shewanella sp.]|nr:DUF2804 domain-containing protein [Shewanella sp.]MCF1430470.1 DUF2804 domain-containing protein [Shewanella sp.]MCF1438280.1 DUF2804 domain-containing protein [Shewanella sp.]MCF1458141.1 DUF2804 domain-containing protein [Shewanella sp.]